jgi:MipA family protein
MKMLCLCIGMVMFGFSALLNAASLYQENDGWHGIVGVGGIVRTEPYQDINYRILPFPYVIMRRGGFFIEGLEIGYRVVESNQATFDVILTPRLEGFDANEGAIFNGLEDRDFSLDGGIATGWRQGTIEFNLSAVTDLLHKSHGREVKASIGKTYILTGKMTLLTPSIGLKWKSENLVNYYYGVSPTQGNTNRPGYLGEATLNYIAAVNGTYSLTKRSTLFAGVEYEKFGDDISDSPLVKSEKMISVFLGYGWQF